MFERPHQKTKQQVLDELEYYCPPRNSRHSESRQRLTIEVARTLAELDQRKPATESEWWERAHKLAIESQGAIDLGQYEGAWGLILDSRRCLIPLLSEEEKAALTISLEREVSAKVKGWRGEAVTSLLHGGAPNAEHLIEAAQQLDTAYTNKRRHLRLRRIELTVLMAVLIGALVAIFLTLLVGPGIDFENVTFNNTRLAVLVALFGVVGASLSAIQRVYRRGWILVPDQRAAAVVSICRSLSGAGFGLVTLAAAQAGLLGDQAGSVLIAAFAAGFSERYILRFVSDGREDTAASEVEADSPSVPNRGAGGAPQLAEAAPGGSLDVGKQPSDPRTYFRANVGAAILNDDGQVLAFERKDYPGRWQLPQGGIEPGETPIVAVLRELKEETGLNEADIELLEELPEWLAYELPEELQSGKTGRGQVQRWFLFRLHPSATVQMQTTSAPAEFVASKWVGPSELVNAAVAFRQPAYNRIAKAIDELRR